MKKNSIKLQEETTKDIINWIECNIDQKIDLNMVAEKSGYTKWYFQRLFKEYTGISIGHYIRCRRLSNAAIDLKQSNNRILDISIKYNFDSQQSFSRSFKSLFKITPLEYRRSEKIKLDAFQIPFICNREFIFDYEIKKLQMPDLYLHKSEKNQSTIKEIKKKLWKYLPNKNGTIPNKIIFFRDIEKNQKEMKYNYTMTSEENIGTNKFNHNVTEGDFIEFKITNKKINIDIDRIIQLMNYFAINKLNLNVLIKTNIELYKIKEGTNYNDFIDNPSNYIYEVRYYIPIHEKNNII
ncbi:MULTISPECIES: helix-turn-helix domain-containing protein [Providencia]|uniref:Helix-turn-helix domain-containing protein n=1 Tax=Providencia huaxiensis TaxID=2027290 RepID=A0ABU2IST4_9GAMM|nr:MULTISPECIES: helix-turn-helix domain-containing protein [Providencia]MBZ3680824.1 helix-turn-helix domain-containing protein [Providencia rettgeri]AXH63328.1 helix-turn-helix domain-containing protein [Providencia huaxiensis]MDT0131864.1 helix-turn-helix domain-containing protein [Providencia huaxiensis]MDT1978270.1 helix-turn-helix domain-containing protein [Providencia huaxiensis]QLR01415.1 helix-turn-helix domain-containing protein [Providencia rettgeri]